MITQGPAEVPVGMINGTALGQGFGGGSRLASEAGGLAPPRRGGGHHPVAHRRAAGVGAGGRAQRRPHCGPGKQVRHLPQV